MNIDIELLKKYIAAKADEEEIIEVESWISSDEANRLYFEKIRRYYSGESISDGEINAKEKGEEWNKFRQATFGVKQNRKKIILKVVSACAAAILIFSVILYSSYKDHYFVNSSSDMISETTNEVKGNLVNDVILITSSGELFNIENDNNKNSLMSGKNLSFAHNGIDYTNAAEKQYNETIEYHEVVVPRGKDWRIVLSDSTVVYLNADSKLKFPNKFVKGEKRLVYLEGEGYFEVAKNSESQFVVSVNGIDVKVYGTKFNVRGYDVNTLMTVLIEGSVGVSMQNGMGGEIKMKPNQLCVTNCSNGKMNIYKVMPQKYVSWIKGSLSFEGDDFGYVIDELSRVYGVDFSFSNTNLKDIKVTGEFKKTTNIQDLLSLMEKSLGVLFINEGGRYMIE